MKKVLSLCLIFAMIFCFAACGNNQPVEVKGAFNLNNKMVTIVFDYSDYETPLPENAEEITLTVNETIYNISQNHEILNHNTGVQSGIFDCYERYYGYSYALGYGTVSQDTPKRMIAVFTGVENADLSNVTFTLGQHVIELTADDFTDISSQSEIIKAEDNFEEAYQIAAFKWRIDSAYTMEEQMDIYDEVPFGSEFDYLSEQIALTFAEDVNWGIEIFAQPGSNYTHKGVLESGVANEKLPAFDAEVVKKAFPDATNQIDAIIDSTNTLSKEILDPSKSLDDFDVKGTRGEIKGAYSELCNIFDMDLLVTAH